LAEAHAATRFSGPASCRWVVERTFSWIDQNRRMSKDYERLTESSEAFIYVAMSRLMARRLACS
jgi:putative transposase